MRALWRLIQIGTVVVLITLTRSGVREPALLGPLKACNPDAVALATTPGAPIDSLRLERAEQIRESIPTGEADLVLLGDSLMQFWPQDAWSKTAPDKLVLNMGLANDQTQNVLWRLAAPELRRVKPKATILLVGTNNLFADMPPCAIDAGVRAIALRIRILWPASQLIVIQVPPIGQSGTFKDPARQEIHALLTADGLDTIDIDRAITCNGQEPCPNYSADFVHFSPAGYAVLTTVVEQKLGWR